MSKKRIISVLLLAVYLLATGSNALGLMLCDCAAHSRYDLCCRHGHIHGHSHNHTAECCGEECTPACDSEHFGANLTEPCSCSHSHADAEIFTLSPEPNELLKYIKPFVGETVCGAGMQASLPDAHMAAALRVCRRVPTVRPPVICAGSPRAPSFSA